MNIRQAPPPQPPSTSRSNKTSVVEVHGLGKRFGNVTAVHDVSFTVNRGEIFGILGPNGAGKSTTVECIAGAFPVETGTVQVLGVDPASERSFIRQNLGYQLQSTALPAALRVEESLALFAAFYQHPVPVGELLRSVGLEAVRKRPFGALSGGQQQRLSIALALVGSPEIVILDELTTGLDPHGRREVWDLVQKIRDGGVTIILVSHYLDEVERLCDRVAVIASGRTRFVGTPAELLTASATPTHNTWTLEDAYLALVAGPPAAA